MLKNILALIGLITVVKVSYQAYNEHLREPLERKLADTIEDERSRHVEPAAAAPAVTDPSSPSS